ncbi:MAG: 50S ribosomal protein L22 [Deltaproteobacteria bacterium]|nr:50S ribosomal protein L22 [Deltaproteobacteria bacterium]
MDSFASLRFAKIAPRKARVIINLIRGRKVSEAIEMTMFTQRSAAPLVRKLLESALANAKNLHGNVNEDELYVTHASVDKGPNRHTRRWRPRAMGRATKVTKGVSHIEVGLGPQPVKAALEAARKAPFKQARKAAAATATVTPPVTETASTEATTPTENG